jgi:hypothetical protein
MDRYRVGSQMFLFAPNLHTRRQDCDSSARCDRLTGYSYLTSKVRLPTIHELGSVLVPVSMVTDRMSG